MYTLKELKKYCLNCRKCSLYSVRTKVVFGEGNENADIMLVGEGPGYNEDKQGRPFVGRAGKLLDKMLLAINLNREDVYISNIVKCRPPDNRNPYEEECKECIEYLRWQFKLIKPKIIVCLGSIASKNIISPELKITSNRGKWINKNGIYIMPTYHPAALLRDTTKKRQVWKDLKQLKNKYECLTKGESDSEKG